MVEAGDQAAQNRGSNALPLLWHFEAQSRIADSLAAVGVMGAVFGFTTNWREFIPSSEARWSPEAWGISLHYFFAENGWAPILSAAAIIVYVAGRVFARKNVGQLRSLFADANTPTGNQIMSWPKFVVMVYGQLVLIFFMVLCSTLIIVPCLGWMALHALYIHSNNQQALWLPTMLASERHKPTETHPHYEFFMQRRAEALRYVQRRHNAREWMVITGALSAIVLDASEAWGGFAHGNSGAYIILLSFVLANEMIVGLWRAQLSAAFWRINLAQFRADVLREL